jgi:hypothetical protein
MAADLPSGHEFKRRRGCSNKKLGNFSPDKQTKPGDFLL